MEFELYQYLNNYSLHAGLTDPEFFNIHQKKTERLAIKDTEWPEIHTILTAGYIHNPAKFGFDGFNDVHKTYCEVKSSSKVINKDLILKFDNGLITQRNQFIENPIDGRGVFSLFTHDAFHRYLKHDVMMLVSAYINGVLMFIIEFPFKHPDFKNHIQRMLEKKLPNGDKPGRSKTVSFAYTQYKTCMDSRLIYFTSEKNEKILKGSCTRNFYSYLKHLQSRRQVS